MRLAAAAADSPRLNDNKQAHDDWFASAHARAGVNCSACHQPSQVKNAVWTDHPDQSACSTCHSLERDGFLAGKHGMRVNQGLSPMTPSQGRLEFKRDAAHRDLGCTSCHGAHRFDTQYAAVQACMKCHNDEHSLAYDRSPHAKLWRAEVAQKADVGSGVSCASCHMPRTAHTYEEYDLKQMFVQHNQNDTLRPNAKMIRPVCMNCHGLRFSIDALADKALVQNNFAGLPTQHVASIDMALERVRRQEEKKRTELAAQQSPLPAISNRSTARVKRDNGRT
jgi:hypothetical protein